MVFKLFKSFTVAVFSLFLFLFSAGVAAQGEPGQTDSAKHDGAEAKKGFDAKPVIFSHIMDAHEFHFLSYKSNGEEKEVTIPLPVLLYSPQRGFCSFMASRFDHGHTTYNNYKLLTNESIEEMKLDPKKFSEGQVVAITPTGEIDTAVSVYDFSLTRNVVQMLLALSLITWILLAIAKKYKRGEGVTSSPKGMQNAIETVVNFITDDIAKPNLGHKYRKYLPYLLTVFFFILINNLFGLIPGTANVTGNIAFTLVLSVISFIVIMFSTNKHYWSHIVWPPVPLGVKIILIPVEILGIFTKPFALMIRLFANMVAGHILIICLISLIFIFGAMNQYVGWGTTALSIPFTIFIYFIELLVAFLQAYIFVFLTAVFIGQASENGHPEVDGHAVDVII